jgi:hypothetical protein
LALFQHHHLIGGKGWVGEKAFGHGRRDPAKGERDRMEDWFGGR